MPTAYPVAVFSTLLLLSTGILVLFPIFRVFSYPGLGATWSSDECVLSSGLQQKLFELQSEPRCERLPH